MVRSFYPPPPPPLPPKVLRTLFAKFDTFVTSVTIRPIFCTKRPDYKPNVAACNATILVCAISFLKKARVCACHTLHTGKGVLFVYWEQIAIGLNHIHLFNLFQALR